MTSKHVTSNTPFTLLFISLFGSGIWVRFCWTIWGLHMALAEVSGWWSSAGGWLVKRVRNDVRACYSGGCRGQVGLHWPSFLYNPSCQAVVLLFRLLRTPRANVPRDGKWQPSAFWVPSTLPLCWLSQPPSPWGSGGHSLPISAEGVLENLWLFLICYVRMCNYFLFFNL